MSSRPSLLAFPRVFWIANVMELFERAAYYGLNSVLAVYLTDSLATGGLGFSEQSVGFLQSLIYACTYVLPILGGALADRYGYRRMLLVAFSLLATGYFVSGHQSGYAAVFAALLIMATGAGLFKPIISGTLARSTTEENSGLGFGIYYWMINLGAFAAPLVVTWLRGFSWTAVFTASSLYCALMLLPTLFLYRDPPLPQSTTRLRTVLSNAGMVLGDARFMLMIFIYSGFWILYFQNFGSMLWYLRDFLDPTPVNRFLQGLGLPISFNAEHVTVVNAGTIILLQVLISRMVQRLNPLLTMTAGMAIGVLGFVCLALSMSIWVFIAGIAIFSVGEMTAHPKYYSYIGIVAPADRKAVYMGYAFLYGVIGSLLGSNLGGALYESMLKPVMGFPEAPQVAREFWLIFAALDVVSVVGLLLYHRNLAADTPRNNRRARTIMNGIYVVLLAIGVWFIATAMSAETVSARTVVQALIVLVMGAGGLWATRRAARLR